MIRIYNLAGILARRLIKDDPSTQYFNWDLKNAHGRPVGSGIYIAYIEMQDEAGIDLGNKTLKLAIFQEERF